MAEFEHPSVIGRLGVQGARELHADLVRFLAEQPSPPKPLTGQESHGGDMSLMKGGSARRNAQHRSTK